MCASSLMLVWSFRGSKFWSAATVRFTLPGQPVLKDGKLKRDINGKPSFAPTVHLKDRATADKFSRAVIKLRLAKYPGAGRGAMSKWSTMRLVYDRQWVRVRALINKTRPIVTSPVARRRS
jgi:hypothetical protein